MHLNLGGGRYFSIIYFSLFIFFKVLWKRLKKNINFKVLVAESCYIDKLFSHNLNV